MKNSESSREFPKWGTLNRDILATIFGKLHVIDITNGASRVCISWFLASHDKTLWNTVNLLKLKEVEEKETLSLSNVLTKIIKFFYDFCDFSTTKNLRNITKLSRTVPKNLFFNFNSFILDKDLIMFAAESIPNIEKLVLPLWYCQTESSVRFAFRQWKNLKTLIIAHEWYLNDASVFQAVGKSCSNLTNLKYVGYVGKIDVALIVRYLRNLKMLSLRCCVVSNKNVFWLIKCLQNLKILNLSHCKDSYWYPLAPSDILLEAATQKLDQFIVCSPKDCRVCKDRPSMFRPYAYFEKHWRNDELNELEF